MSAACLPDHFRLSVIAELVFLTPDLARRAMTLLKLLAAATGARIIATHFGLAALIGHGWPVMVVIAVWAMHMWFR